MPAESRPRILVEGPAHRAMIAGGFGPVQRTLALAPVKATEMPAAERHPHHTLAVDVSAARSKARQWDVVDLGERRRRRARAGIEPHDGPFAGEHADGAPHRTRRPGSA
jgi:hypothetical protein